MFEKTASTANNPLKVSSSIANFARTIRDGNIYRCGQYACDYVETLSSQVSELQEQYEGKLIEHMADMLDVLVDIVTSDDKNFDDHYCDFWSKMEQLDRETYKLRHEVTLRAKVS